MSLLEVNVNDVEDLHIAAAGEYLLEVRSAEVKKSEKTGGDYLMVWFMFKEEPGTKDISNVFMMPTEEDDERTKGNRLRALKNFCKAFEYDASDGIESDDLVGLEGYAIVGEKDDPEYGEQNNVRRWVVPK